MLTSSVQINKGKKMKLVFSNKTYDTFYNVAFLNHILIDGELNTFWFLCCLYFEIYIHDFNVITLWTLSPKKGIKYI